MAFSRMPTTSARRARILEFVLNAKAKEFIIGTERHIIHQMEKAAPDKVFLPVPGADGGCSCSNCPFMALNTLEKIYLTLLNNAPRIELPEPLRLAALKPLERMLEMSASVPIALASATRGPCRRSGLTARRCHQN